MTRKDYQELKAIAEKHILTSPKWNETERKREFRNGYNSAIHDILKLV